MFLTPSKKEIIESSLICHQLMVSIWLTSKFCHFGLTLPNNKILDVTKLKVFSDDRINKAQMIIFVTIEQMHSRDTETGQDEKPIP